MTRARGSRAALALAGVLLAANGAEAIVGGTPLPGAEADAVVLVAYQGGSAICSGTVIAPAVVLTAASCLPDLVPGNYAVLGGATPFSSPAFTIAASAVHRHPDYDAPTFAHDVAVIELASPAPVAPWPWLASDTGVYEPGLSVTFVGYGVDDATQLTGSGVRRGGVAPIAEKLAGSFSIATEGQSPCAGDTGGPALPAEPVAGDVVAGVVSYGDQDCAQYAVFARTDANAGFLAQYAPEPSAASEAVAAVVSFALLGGGRASRRARAG